MLASRFRNMSRPELLGNITERSNVQAAPGSGLEGSSKVVKAAKYMYEKSIYPLFEAAVMLAKTFHLRLRVARNRRRDLNVCLFATLKFEHCRYQSVPPI